MLTPLAKLFNKIDGRILKRVPKEQYLSFAISLNNYTYRYIILYIAKLSFMFTKYVQEHIIKFELILFNSRA